MNAEGSEEKNEPGEVDYNIIDEEIIQDFLNESNEGLQQLEVDFLTLEKDPCNIELLNSSFRVIHSIKGSAGFMGFKNLASLSHIAEDVLNKLRKSEIILNAGIMDSLLNAVDTIKHILEEIKQSGNDTSINTEDAKKILENIASEKNFATDVLTGQKQIDVCLDSKNKQGEKSDWGMAVQIPDMQFSHSAPDNIQKHAEKDLPPAVIAESVNNFEGQSAAIKDKTTLPSARITTKKEEMRSIRIDVDKLDSLFNLVGELVLSRNRNLQLYRLLSGKYPSEEIIHQDLTRAGDHLDHLISELQWAVMKTRMMPISTVFNKFQRVVRDTGKTLGKDIELHIAGEDTEIDKNVIEGIGDPMTHIIRNACDHGIETPDERAKAGKDKTGHIYLDAFYEGNYMIIEIRDDGKGINVDAVKEKAIERGLITPAEANTMQKAALLNLIFEPGFSTAKSVSAVSGRGVGMDVVKTNIEKLRGQVIINSETGIGSTIKLKIPLTLAILDTLIVNVGDHRYAVPLSNIVETHRIKCGQIERLQGNMVFRTRDGLMHVAALSDIINLPFPSYNADLDVAMLVLREGSFEMGLLVDKTAEQEEVVIKSLDCLEGIAEPHGISGATILGDGAIAFILDVNALLKRANITSLHQELAAKKETDEISAQLKGTFINVVMVDNFGKEQYAIPSKNVKEIEIIHKSDIDEVCGRSVIKHKGSIISLADISSVTNVADNRMYESYYMLILTDKKNDVGFLVGKLLGIKNINEKLFKQDNVRLNGVIGSAIYEGRITLLLDTEEIKDSVINRQFLIKDTSSAGCPEPQMLKHNILIVDDTKAHRKIVEDVVKEAGHKPIVAVDGRDALNKLDGSISLILTDLEMPNMNGYEFTKEAKKRYPKTPVIMVTSMSGEEDRAKGIRYGVDKYVVKWKKNEVLDEIRKYLPR